MTNEEVAREFEVVFDGRVVKPTPLTVAEQRRVEKDREIEFRRWILRTHSPLSDRALRARRWLDRRGLA